MKSAVVAVLQKENRDNGSGTMSGKRVAAVSEGDTGRSGHRHKHGGLWGRSLERLWRSSLELSSSGISGWALPTSPFKSALSGATQVGGWMAGWACPKEKQSPSMVARR